MIKIPESITVNTGHQHIIRPQIDQFIEDVYKEINDRDGLDQGATMHPYFEIKSGELCYNQNAAAISNDRMTYLTYKDQIVALIAETRTEMNHVRFDFFLSMPKTSSAVSQIIKNRKDRCANPKNP